MVSPSFNIGYRGPERQHESYNRKSALARPDIFRKKVSKELKLGQVLGPFTQPPMTNFQCSPMGLVPKKGNPGKYRLIMDLSHPEGDSINTYIPKDGSLVSYKPFDLALWLIRKQGRGCYMAKANLDSASRNLPICKKSLRYLGFVMYDLYYLDTWLPFGAVSSCAIF